MTTPPVECKEEGQEIASSISRMWCPPFDAEDVETWFVCLEAAFCMNAVKLDKHMFNAVIVALGTQAKHFHSAIAKCNTATTSDRYLVIKKAVIDHFKPSESERLTSLLSGVSLGDQKPSQLLSQMRRMGGDRCSNAVLSNIWLRALTPTVRSIIAAIPSASLDEQAVVADKIMEVPNGEVSAVRTRAAENCSSQANQIAALEGKVEALTQRLEEVLAVHRPASFDRRPRQRSRTRESWGRRSSETRKKSPRRWICWFHYRYGNKAERCERDHPSDRNTQCIFFDEQSPLHQKK